VLGDPNTKVTLKITNLSIRIRDFECTIKYLDYINFRGLPEVGHLVQYYLRVIKCLRVYLGHVNLWISIIYVYHEN
jgi:hypothetical protein